MNNTRTSEQYIPNGNPRNTIERKNKIFDYIFYCIMAICLLFTCFALVFFIISLFKSNSMIAQSTISGLKPSEDISLEGYLKLQMQLQEIRSSAIETNTFVFIYQFISGVVIGIAGYLIKVSADRVKEAAEMTKDIEEKTKDFEDKVALLTEATTQITESQLECSKDLINGRAFSYINHIYSSLQIYVLLSIGSSVRNSTENDSQKFITIKRINQEIENFDSFFNSTMKSIENWNEKDKRIVLEKMMKEINQLGEILKKKSFSSEDYIASWNEMIDTIHKKILAHLYPI